MLREPDIEGRRSRDQEPSWRERRASREELTNSCWLGLKGRHSVLPIDTVLFYLQRLVNNVLPPCLVFKHFIFKAEPIF